MPASEQWLREELRSAMSCMWAPYMRSLRKAELRCAGSQPEERPGQHQQGPGRNVHQLAAELLIQHTVLGQGLPQLHLHIAGGGVLQS